MTQTVWTEEKIAELKRLYGEGHTCSEIARSLGRMTRNAVIGKAHRLGLKRRKTPSRPVKAWRPEPPILELVKSDATKRVRKAASGDDAGSLKIPLLDLQPHHCRWSTHEEGEHLFCGHDRVEGKSWCKHHAKKAVTRDSERKMRGAQRVVEHFVKQERRAA